MANPQVTERNAKGWRALGYHTIFQQGQIYLWCDISCECFRTSIAFGAWMRALDLSRAPWEPVAFESTHWLRRIAAACYCDQGVGTCDFCAGRRRVDEVA